MFMPDPGIITAGLAALLGLGLLVHLSVRRRSNRISAAPRREQVFCISDDCAETTDLPVMLAAFAQGMAPDRRACLLRYISSLRTEGRGFEVVFGNLTGEYLDVAGFVHGSRAYLSVVNVTKRERQAVERQGQAISAAQDAARQSDLLDNAPYLQWRMDREGKILWSNEVAMRQRGLPPSVPPMLAQRSHVLGVSDGMQQHRMSVQPEDTSAPIWYDVTLVEGSDDVILGYAISAERIIRAEAALSRFVETLTETFAHLPIGLAIFDRDRELGLFNPALAELLRLDPAWLAGRPTLTGLLNHLRERRALPDQRDFRGWSEQITSLGRDCGMQDFTEVWVQPSGRTLRVVGRPHPQGAVAFLLEDITPAVTLEQQFREGMTLRAAALESRPGTHLIFDISGAAGFVGTEFSTLTGVSAEPNSLAIPGAIHEVLRQCREAFGPAPIWDRVLSYVVGRHTQTERKPLTVPLRRDGVVLHVLELNPLPGGGTLLSLLPPESSAQVVTRTLRRAVDLALEQGRSVTEPADITVTVMDDGTGQIPCTHQDLIRRAGYTMLLAAVDVVAAGQGVTLTLSQLGEDAIFSVTGDSSARGKDIGSTLPVSLLRRYLSEVSGELSVVEAEQFVITARIPRSALVDQDEVEAMRRADAV